LLALSDWLQARGVDHVAMESTGVYWKTIFNLLEGNFQIILVNAQRLQNVPGRKADVKDAEWIAQVLQYGLLSPSFIPPPEIRQLRDLTRQRTQLIRDRATVANRTQKTLEDANLKLGDVASDVLGVSGRAMIQAIIAGENDGGHLAELAKQRLRAKIPALKLALHGGVTEHHRFLLRALMDQIASLDGLIARFDARIEQAMTSFGAAAERLRETPAWRSGPLR
jgi:transposase